MFKVPDQWNLSQFKKNSIFIIKKVVQKIYCFRLAAFRQVLHRYPSLVRM